MAEKTIDDVIAELGEEVNASPDLLAKIEFIKLQEKILKEENYDVEYNNIVHLIKQISTHEDELMVDYLLSLKEDKNLLMKVAIYNLHNNNDLECSYSIFDHLLEKYPDDKQIKYLYAKSLINGVTILKKHLGNNPDTKKDIPTCESDDYITLDELYYKSEKMFESLLESEQVGSPTWLHYIRQLLYIIEQGDSLIKAKTRAKIYVDTYPHIISLKLYFIEYLNHFPDITNSVKIVGLCKEILLNDDTKLTKEESLIAINILQEATQRIQSLKKSY